MLKINRNTTLTGTIDIDGVAVVYLNATIKSEGAGADVTKSIANQDLYNSNRVAIREDMATFEKEVYKVEDELVKEAAAQKLKIEKRGK